MIMHDKIYISKMDEQPFNMGAVLIYIAANHDTIIIS